MIAHNIDINGAWSKRGILEQALAAGAYLASYKWDGRTYQGLTIPIFDPYTDEIVDTVWKNAESVPGVKYRPRGADGKGYKSSKHPGSYWYIWNSKGTQQAIEAAGGVCYLANGIPSLWAFRAAGVMNSISGRYETSLPADAAEVLTFLGITTLYYPADNDESGRNAALNWRGACDIAGIDYKPLQWGDFAHDKFDANDLWIYTGFNAHKFQQVLSELKPLLLPSRDKAAINYSSSDYDHTPQTLIDAIAQHLGVWGSPTDSDGWTRQATANPIIRHEHDGTNPASYFNVQSGVLHDFKGNHNHSPKALAEHFRIDTSAYYPKRERPKPSAQPTITPETVTLDNGVWFAGTLPDKWRSSLLQYCPATVAPFIELIHESARQGYINPQNFTIQEVLDTRKMLGLNLAEGTIRKYFKAMLGVLFSKVNILKEKEYMLKIENKSHRPPTIYQLLPLDEVKKNILAWARPRIIERVFPKQDRDQLVTVFEQQMLQDAGLDESESAAITELLNQTTADYRFDRDEQYKRRMKRAAAIYRSLEAGLRSLHSTELLPIPMDNAKDYRAVFVRSQVEAGQNNRSGNEIARSLGVRREYVGEVLKHAGISNEDKFEAVTIDAENVERLDTIGYEVKGYPRTVTIDNTRIIPYSDDCQTIINEAITNGQQVEIVYQVASEQVIARDAILPEKPVRDAKPEQPEKVEAEPKPKVETPVRDEKPRHYGKTFDPNWIKHHLILTLHIAQLGYIVRQDRLTDKRTGEVLRYAVTVQDLIVVLTGQMLETESQGNEQYA